MFKERRIDERKGQDWLEGEGKERKEMEGRAWEGRGRRGGVVWE